VLDAVELQRQDVRKGDAPKPMTSPCRPLDTTRAHAGAATKAPGKDLASRIDMESGVYTIVKVNFCLIVSPFLRGGSNLATGRLKSL
jgi:hypothetical protein